MISDFDNPPFAPDPCCSACGKPWIHHDGISQVCRANQDLLVALKATAINTLEIHQTLVKIISHFEKSPQSPNLPEKQD